MPKKSVEESFTVAVISGTGNVGIRKWGVSRFSIEKICLTVQKNSVGESFIAALNSGTEKVWRRGGGGGAPTFSVEKFLSQRAEKLRKGILYCCINFGYRKSVDKRGGEFQDSPSKTFRLTVPKFYVGESFTNALISGSEKV